MRMNLHSRSVLIIASILFLAIGINSAVLTYISYDRYKQAVLSEATSVGNAMMKEIDKVIVLGLSIENIEGLNERLKSVTEDTTTITIGYAMILDMKGRILFHSDEKDVGKRYKDPVTLEALASNKTLVQEWGDFYDIESPLINAEGKHVGMLRIGLVAAILKKELYKLLVWSGSLFVVLVFPFAVIIYFSVSRFITRPITKLGNVVADIAKGNLDVKAEVTSEDEIGKLSESFNKMAMELKESRDKLLDYSTDLETKVESRTAELKLSNEQLNVHAKELEQRNLEIHLLSNLVGILQTCLNSEEAYLIIAQRLSQIFPENSGALYLFKSSRNLLEIVVVWGKTPPEELMFAPDDCSAMRRILTNLVLNSQKGLPCKHAGERTAYLCIPMMTQGEVLGLMHLVLDQSDADKNMQQLEDTQRLAVIVAENIGLALGNLKLRETMRSLAIRDPLTNLYNRRFMEESLEREIRLAERKLTPIGIIMIDIDHFKLFNDTYGHDAGDSVLREVGMFIKKNIRSNDIGCRYGGEEFMIIMPGAILEINQQRAEHLVELIRNLKIQHGNRLLGSITLSVGVAIYPKHGSTLEVVVQAADAALYKAKQAGRDRVCVAAE